MRKSATRSAASQPSSAEDHPSAAETDSPLPKRDRRPRVMYLENKSGGLHGGGQIGRVTFSKTGSSVYYEGQRFQTLKGYGFKANFVCVETGDQYWISGPKKNGQDGLYGGNGAYIDENVREEYWKTIRQQPRRVNEEFT